MRALEAAPRAHAAQTPTGAPAMVMRAQWGADSVPPRNPPLYGQVQAAFVHHTAGEIDYAPEDSPGIVLGIARYHRDSNGWNDIGYNFLVDRYGTIFEGRAGGIEAAVVGAQAQGYNSQLDRHRLPRDVHEHPPRRARDGVAGEADRLEALPARRPHAGRGHDRQPGRRNQPLPQRHAGRPAARSTATATATRPAARATSSTRSCRTSATAPRSTPHPVSAITVKASSQQGAKPTPVSGQIHFADGSSPAGVPLSIEYTTAGSAWTQVTTTSAGVDGSWATSVVLPASGQVRATFAGDGTRPRVESAPIKVKVVPSMTLTADRRRAPAGTAFAITGTMSPAQHQLTCLLERQSHNRWVTVQRKRILTAHGQYATKVRPRTAGLYRVSIIADGVTRRRTLRAVH